VAQQQGIFYLWIEPCGTATRGLPYCGSSLVAQDPGNFQSVKASNNLFTTKIVTYQQA